MISSLSAYALGKGHKKYLQILSKFLKTLLKLDNYNTTAVIM